MPYSGGGGLMRIGSADGRQVRFQSPHVVVVGGRRRVRPFVRRGAGHNGSCVGERAGSAAQPLLYATVECENAAGWQCIDRQHVALVDGREGDLLFRGAHTTYNDLATFREQDFCLSGGGNS